MIIDLTTFVSENSPLIQWAKSQDNQHVAMGHVGTHLDTYEKSEIPLEYFKSQGIIFDVRGINEVNVCDVDLSLVSADSFVLFRTGQIEFHNYGDKEYFSNHPHLSNELISKLLEKKIRFIGVDCAGIRQHNEHEAADRLCEKNGVYVIENLKGLANLTTSPFTVYTMWLDDSQMTGLRCRVLVDAE